MKKGSIHYMTEGMESALPIRNPEIQQDLPRANLITGSHMVTESEVVNVDNRLAGGDLTAHSWDKSIVSKLISSHPSVLSIDGLVSGYPANQSKRDYDAGQKRNIWFGMPGTPREINSSEEVYVVTGDVVGSEYKNVLQPFYSQNADPAKRDSALAELTKSRPGIDSPSIVTLPDLYVYIPTAAAAIVALTAAVNLGDKQISKMHPETLTAKTYTRRSLLKLGAFGAGMAATGALLGRYGPSVSVPKALNDSVLNTIIRIAKREKSDQASIDGRTALLIEKGITAALSLRKSDVTVVAGTAHTHNQDNLLTSPQARADAIGKYATLLLKIVDGASDKAGFDEKTKLTARGILLDNVMYGQILRVANPPTSKVSPDKVDETLNNAIKFQSDFMVSSNPILATEIQKIRGNAPQVFGPFGG